MNCKGLPAAELAVAELADALAWTDVLDIPILATFAFGPTGVIPPTFLFIPACMGPACHGAGRVGKAVTRA